MHQNEWVCLLFCHDKYDPYSVGCPREKPIFIWYGKKLQGQKGCNQQLLQNQPTVAVQQTKKLSNSPKKNF